MAGIYEIFCGNKNFYVGKQPDPFPGTSNTVCLIAYLCVKYDNESVVTIVIFCELYCFIYIIL